MRTGPGPCPLERVKRIWDLWLVQETECPFATLHALMNYGFILTKDSIVDGRVKWSDDGQTVLFWGHLVEMHEWKSFVLNLIEELETSLFKSLMFGSDGRSAPDVNLWDIKDDQAQEGVGHYFASASWDEMREQMMMWLLLVKDPLGLLGECDEGRIQKFMRAAVDRYNELDKQF